jgi:hypothetical protein
MGTLYTSQAAAGYNSSPPPDDGSQGANNQITWGTTIKAKLADPIKALADAINSQLTTALDLSPRAISTPDSAVASDHWRTLQVTGTTTITLSDAATMTNKYVVGIANLGVGTVTVTRATGANTVNGTAADFTLAPKQAVMLGVNQGATGYNILAHSLATGAGINTIQATTSVVTPLVTSGSGNLEIKESTNTSRWVLVASDGSFQPNAGDNTQNIGAPAGRIKTVFTPIIDSGTTGSLSLKTNSGETGFVVNHGGTSLTNRVEVVGNTTGNPAALSFTGSDTNVTGLIRTKGTGVFSFITDAFGIGPVQLQILHTASATRNITVTGSNGGNPTISTTAGDLAITPNVAVAGSFLSIGTNPAAGGNLRLPFNNLAIEARNSGNTGDIAVMGVATVNSVNDIITFGNLSASSPGVILTRRSRAAAATTSDIPDGCWALWRDTSGATTKLIYNNGGSLQTVALV